MANPFTNTETTLSIEDVMAKSHSRLGRNKLTKGVHAYLGALS